MIRTKASLAKAVSPDSNFKLVKFDGSKKRLPKTKPPTTGNKSESEDSEFERVFGDGPKKKKSKKGKDEVTFQSARREVMNFGIAGSAASDKLDLNQQLAIKLGARPPKNPTRNYKEILEEKRKQKEHDKSINRRALFGTSASLQFRSQKRKVSRRNDGLLKGYGKLKKDQIPSEHDSSSKKLRKR